MVIPTTTTTTADVPACFQCPKPALEGRVLLVPVADSTNVHLGGIKMETKKKKKKKSLLPFFSLYLLDDTVIFFPLADVPRSALHEFFLL